MSTEIHMSSLVILGTLLGTIVERISNNILKTGKGF